MDEFEACPGDMLVMGNDPVNVFLVDVDLARNLASLGDNFEWTFRVDQYEAEVAARGPGMKEDIALRFRAAKDLPSRERVAKEDLDPAVKAALGLTRRRRARRTGASKKRKTAGSAGGLARERVRARERERAHHLASL